MPTSTKSRVDGIRRIVTPFLIRGDIRRNTISKRRQLGPQLRRIPAYYIDPNYAMGTREWLGHLHATIHAAVGRAIKRTDYRNWRDILPEDLPHLMVFGHRPIARTSASDRQTFLNMRDFQKGLRSSVPSVEFRHQLPQYETALFQGGIRPTFRESYLTTADGKVANPKLFEVKLTKKEFFKITRRINKRLRENGLPPLERLPDPNRMSAANKGQFFKKLAAVGRVKKLVSTEETSPDAANPAQYLVYLEASRLLTNKFMKKAESLLRKHVPE